MKWKKNIEKSEELAEVRKMCFLLNVRCNFSSAESVFSNQRVFMESAKVGPPL